MLTSLPQCCLRYVHLYTLICAQLDTLTSELARLKEYEDLFGTSVEESTLRHQRRREKAFSVCACPYPWLLDSPDFKAWMDQTNDCRGLWLKGGSSTRKSVLCSYAVTLAKSKALDAGLAFHYYRFDEQLNATMIYRNISAQLYDQLYRHEDDVSDFVYDLTKNNSNSQETLKEMTKLLVSELASAYIFVDGLDEECVDKSRWEEASEVVCIFKSILEDEGSTVKFWCGSQDRPNIRATINSFT
jgi:hypothetical protein